MLDVFYKATESRYFWLTGALYLVLMEAIALYYQYVLDFYPCALCVQVRAWVTSAIALSLVTLFVRKHFWLRSAGLTLTMGLLGGALNTTWYAYGVEKGTILSSCTMGAGFPEFMPLDQWIPWLFEAQGACGLSPDMLFGLTMIESLLITIAIPFLALFVLWSLHFRGALTVND